jgi:hypothetical protein
MGPDVIRGAWRCGNRMVVSADAELPDRCVKTGRPADGEWADIRLRWHHPALYIVLLVNVIVYFIVAHFVSTSVIVRVGVIHDTLTSARCARRILWMLLLLAGGVSCFLAVAGVSLLWWLVAALMVLSALVFFPRGRLIWATRMEHSYVWIAGVHPDYLALLPEWPR